MRKIFNLILILLMCIFVSGYTCANECAYDLRGLSYTKININGIDEYVYDGELFNNVENIVINNLDQYGKIKNEYHAHVVLSSGDEIIFCIDDVDELMVSTVLHGEAFAQNKELVRRYDYLNSSKMNKKVNSKTEPYLSINEMSDTDFYIDTYKPPYYSTTESVDKVDDPILNIVPREYFYSEVDKIVEGREYIYYIKTVSDTGEIGLKYRSMVAVYDIESVSLHTLSGTINTFMNQFVDNQYARLMLEPRFMYYYKTYERDGVSDYDWTFNYNFSDDLNKIVVATTSSGIFSVNLLPKNLTCTYFLYDKFDKTLTFDNNFLSESSMSVIFKEDKYERWDPIFLKTFLKVLKNFIPQAEMVETAVEFSSFLYNGYVAYKNNQFEGVVDEASSSENKIVNDTYSGRAHVDSSNYSFLNQRNKYVGINAHYTLNAPNNDTEQHFVTMINDIDISKIHDVTTELYYLCEANYDEMEVGNKNLYLEYSFDITNGGETKTFNGTYAFDESLTYQSFPSTVINPTNLHINKSIEFVPIMFTTNKTLYISPNDNSSEIAITVYNSAYNNLNKNPSKVISNTTSVIQFVANEVYYITTKAVYNNYILNFYSLERIYYQGQNRELNYTADLTSNKNIKYYYIAAEYNKIDVITDGYGNPALYLLDDYWNQRSYNDDYYAGEAGYEDDLNAIIKYERNVVYDGGHYLMLYANQYSNEIESIRIKFILSKTR